MVSDNPIRDKNDSQIKEVLQFVSDSLDSEVDRNNNKRESTN